MPIIFFPWYGMIPIVLGRLTLSILSPKVPQDLTFIRRMSGVVDETGFWFALRAIYISLLALSSTLYSRGVSLIWGGLSFIILSVISTVGICLDRFLIRRFHYTFVNRLCGFRTLKHLNILFKRNRLVIKALNMGLFRTDIRNSV